MANTPEVESFQNNLYTAHNKSIYAENYHHQNNYLRLSTTPKIVKPVYINQQYSKASVKIGITNFHYTKHQICINISETIDLLY
jgi:hypothetical protein